MTPVVSRRVVAARIYGLAEVPMGLEYRISDPVAIAITLGCRAGHSHRWHVARDVIRDGLAGVPLAFLDQHWAGSVLVSRLDSGDRALLVLRDRDKGLRIPVTVPAAGLAGFLADSYLACPPEHEARLVDRELDVQIGFFHMTQGGDKR